MLVKATGQLASNFYLLTLGRSCHYLAGTPEHFYLFDPGLSCHIPMLLKRLNERQFAIKNCAGVILTHLHADRAGGVPYLKQLNPSISVIASHGAKTAIAQEKFVRDLHDEDFKLSNIYELGRDLKRLPFDAYRSLFSIDKTLSDSANFTLTDELSLRVLAFSGHSKESLAYFLQPHGFLIADQGIGYFQGKDLPAPGFDENIEAGLEALNDFLNIEINGICMCSQGVLTAQLVRKHLQSTIQNIKDIQQEAARAFKSGMNERDVRKAIAESFYQDQDGDQLNTYNLERSLEGLWQQLLKAK